MSIMVTGGTGLIGSNVARAFISTGREVVILDRQGFPNPENNVLYDLTGKYQMAIGNVADLAFVLDTVKKYKVEGICHFAALTGVGSLEHPIESLQVNVIGSANMLEAARLMNLKRVILTSSSVVFGAVDDLSKPRREEDVILPASGMYEVCKITIEQLSNTYREVFGVDCVALRPHAVYGPGAQNHYEHQPINQMIRGCLSGKGFVQDAGGESANEFTYVKDYAKGVTLAYDHRGPLPYYVYNLGNGRNRTLAEVAGVLRGVFPDQKIELGPGLWPGAIKKAAQKGQAHRVAERAPHDNSRARKDFGYNPEWPIERSIPDWIRWLREKKY